jgi:iron complex outermembrane receptor protein
MTGVQGIKAESVEVLLQKLNKEKDLYKKTVDESAGIVLVYTREDLERMQAHTLKDLLKSTRFLSYSEGITGEAILSMPGSSHPLSSAYRLYIDGHEVSSPIFGSAIFQFAEMDLGFVDHVEIYQGGNAIAFGNEPGIMTIRIYSKKPDREGGSTFGLYGTTLGGHKESATLIQGTQTWRALEYLAAEQIRRKKLSTQGGKYSKDEKTLTFYGKLVAPEHFRITAAHFRATKDAFAGIGSLQTPGDSDKLSWEHSFVTLNVDLPHNTTLELSADFSHHDMSFTDPSGGIWIPWRLLPAYSLEGGFDEEIFKGSYRGAFEHPGGNFKWGIEGILKRYSIDHLALDRIPMTQSIGPTRLMIASIYGEESWHVTPSDLLVGTLKIDYLRNNLSRSDTEYSARIGWIHLFSLENSFKLFYNRTYLYPGFFYTSTYPKALYPSPELDSEHFHNVVAEWNHQQGNHHLRLGVLWQQKEDAVTLDPLRRMFVNSQRDCQSTQAYVNYSYSFSPFDRIDLEYYRGWADGAIGGESPLSGATLRVYNRFGSWDLYNELIYREGYATPPLDQTGVPVEIKDGWDYSVGLQWRPLHNLTLSVKGENLLGRALKSPLPVFGGVEIFDRKVTFSVEYFY